MSGDYDPKLGLTSKDGVLTGVTTGDRVVILPTKFFEDLVVFLRNAYGESIDVALARFAQDYGGKFARDLIAQGMSPQGWSEVMEKLAHVSGWGKVNVEGDVAKGGSLTVEVKDCPFRRAGDGAQAGDCGVMAGIATGIVSACYEKEFQCSHARLPGEDQRCSLSLSEATSKAPRNWKSVVYFPWLGRDDRR